MSKPIAAQIIEHLQLKPLVGEGGYFAEAYRSAEVIDHLPARYTGPRSLSTAIYYLLTPETVSKFHRLKSDEVWHFYLGDPVDQVQLHPDGSGEIIRLGQNILNGECSQALVRQNTWQGARLAAGGNWALMGCTVAPGFDFADFELAQARKLLQDFPSWARWIQDLTA